jgi:ribosomal protein S27E
MTKVEQEPSYNSIKNELNGDTVSRQAVKEQMIKYGFHAPDMTVTEFVEDLQPVTPQPKTGHWITKDGKEQGYDIAGIKTWYIQIMCSECGFIKTAIEGHTGQYHYCPSCGVRMLEPQERSGEE